MTLIEKSLGVGVGVTAGIMIRVAVVECVFSAPVPVTVIVYVPGAAVPAFMFSVDEPPVITLLDVNEPDAPVGSPLSDKEIVSGLPEMTAVLTV